MEADQFDFVEKILSGSESYNLPLYYHPDYLSICDGKVVCYSIINRTNNRTAVTICFQIVDAQAISLLSAPFGGFHGEKISKESLNKDFLSFIIEKLKSQNIEEIVIKNSPPIYKTVFLDAILFEKMGELRITQETNHHIVINRDDLTHRMEGMQVRRLNKCEKAGFWVKEEEPSSLNRIYEFIKSCRFEKNHREPIPLEKLKESTAKLPNAYKFFGCYHQEKLIAATICVKVNQEVLYNFLPASSLDYNQFSPMVFLINELYSYCQRNEFVYLDLGTSMLNELRNEKLISFKSSIGGLEQKRGIYKLQV